MKVVSKMEIFMVMGDLFITREITMKGSLLTIRLKVKALILKLTRVFTKEVGETMSKMDMGKKFGAMVSSLEVCSLMDSKKDEEFKLGTKALDMKENFEVIKCMVRALIIGLMVVNTKASGEMERWMAKEPILGQTGRNTQGII